MNVIQTIYGVRRTLNAALAVAAMGILPLVSAQAFMELDANTQKALGNVGSALMGKAPSASNKPVFYFNYDPGISTKVRDNIINGLISESKKSGEWSADIEKQLREGLGGTDIMQTIGTALEAKGYPKYSLATGLAYFLVVNFEIVYGREFTDTQNSDMLKQLEENIATAWPNVGGMNDAAKQEVVETLMWTATLLYQTNQNLSTEAERQKSRDTSRELLKKLNFDPDRFILTSNGLRPK